MLTIRASQMRALARGALAGRLLEHARTVAPAICASTTEGHLHALIEHCVARCDHHRITRDYDVLRYLNLMLVFGPTFDRDAAWAAGPLAHPNPAARMDLLMDHALLSTHPGVEEPGE